MGSDVSLPNAPTSSFSKPDVLSMETVGRFLPKTSRIPGFAQMNARARLHALVERGLIGADDIHSLLNTGALPADFADSFIENCIGGFTLPLGIATNFLIDGEEVLIPMATEESSVVAAASMGAKLARTGGGFVSQPTQCIATCQVQVFSDLRPSEMLSEFEAAKNHIFEIAQSCHPRLVERGGGVKDVEIRTLEKPGCYVIHIHVDTREAMGANIVNTIAEEVGKQLPTLMNCTVGLRILTNLTVHRITTVNCIVSSSALAIAGFSANTAVKRICAAHEFSEIDTYRAATHNKGVMNGIDPVVIATGNDWRAVEAGCHAYASISGRYRPLTRWWETENGDLAGEIRVPIAVGTVGGVTKLHPTARSVLKILGNPTSDRLSAFIASVGLAQNLAAVRALGCEGIQKGHMSLHEKNKEMMKRYDHSPTLSAVTGDAASLVESLKIDPPRRP